VSHADLRESIEALAARYPRPRSAIMPALHLVQDSRGCLSKALMEEIAEILDVAPVHVYEIATYYSMFRTEPVGRYHIQLCNNVSCMLRGANRLLAHMERKLGIRNGETTADGLFTLSTVECLGACEGAPMMQLNRQYLHNLSEAGIDELLDDLRRKGLDAEAGVATASDTEGVT